MRYICNFILCLFFVICSFSLEAQSDSTYNLLWKIESPNHAKPSYLFGTMHIRDERAFNFSDSVMVALEDCDQFALEIHPDTMVKALYEEILDPDTSNFFKDFMDSIEYRNFTETFKDRNDIDFDQLESKNPIVVNSVEKNNSGLSNDRQAMVDSYLFGIAKTLGKDIKGLEDPQVQIYKMKMNRLWSAKFNFSMDSIMESYGNNKLADTYNSGSLDSIGKELGDRMVNDGYFVMRNRNMTDKLMEYMNSSSTFAAVGAAHLIGDYSVLSMLEKEGYTVTSVASTFTGVADTYEIDFSHLPWQEHKDERYAVSTKFPSTYTDMTRQMANPIDPTGPPFDMNIFLFSDLSNLMSYILVYYDFPSGYYLESEDQGFAATEEELAEMGEIINEPRKINNFGVNGREYEMILQGQYYCKVHVYFRGNRSYRILVQNLDPSEKSIPSDRFFTEFKLLPLKSNVAKNNTTASDKYTFAYFDEAILEKDTIRDYEVSVTNFDYFNDVEPNTGGSYATYFGALDPFFTIENIDTFLNDYANYYIGWSDTIYHKKIIVDNGDRTLEMFVKNKYSRAFSRSRVRIRDNYLIMQSALVDSMQIESAASNSFFDISPTVKSELKFDIYSSKAKDIVKGMISRDSIVKKRAVGALSYYNFKEEELPEIHSLFRSIYKADTSDHETMLAVLNIFNEVHNENSHQELVDLYNNEAVSDAVMSKVLSSLISMNAKEKAVDLLLANPPDQLQSTYNITGVFSDSLDYAIERFEGLKGLMDNKSCREVVLDISAALAKSDSSRHVSFMNENYSDLLIYAEEDIQNYIDTLKTKDGDRYFYSSLTNTYVELFKTYPSKLNRPFLSRLLEVDSTSYVRNQVVLSMITNQMEVNQSDMDSLSKNNYYSYDIIKAYDQINKLDALPDSLAGKENIIKYKMIDYLYYADVYVDDIKKVSTSEIGDSTMYIYEIDDTYDEKGTYYGIVGPVPDNDVLNLKSLKAYYYWVDEGEEFDPKELSQEKITDFRAWAY